MQTAVKIAVITILTLLPGVVVAQNPISIDFDDLSAPCGLGEALPLRDEYAAQGVVFLGAADGGAAVLHECSELGVLGYSSPNFAVIDPVAQLANGEVPDTLFMSFTDDAPRHVRLRVGGPAGTTVYLSCGICPWAIPGCSRYASVVLGDQMSILEVSAAESFPMGCEVHPERGQAGPWIVDDIELRFQVPGEPIPTLSGAGASFLFLVIAGIGFFLIRRAG